MFVMTRPHLGLIIRIRPVQDTIGVHSSVELLYKTAVLINTKYCVHLHEVHQQSHTSARRFYLAYSFSKITQLVSRPPRNYGMLGSLADRFLPRRRP
jgi:hypothetical protein